MLLKTLCRPVALLPQDVQELARKKFDPVKSNPRHFSLHFTSQRLTPCITLHVTAPPNGSSTN